MKTPIPFASRFIGIIACGLLSSAALAGTYVIPISSTFDRGWYNSAGAANPTNSPVGVGGNYTVGMSGEEFRNFFIFQLPLVPTNETLAAAELVLYCTPADDGGYASPDPSESFVAFSVDRSTIASLRARDTNSPAGNRAIFEDLGDGIAYNSAALFTAASQGTLVRIRLNEAFLSYAQTNLGGDVALGGRLTSIRGDPQVGESLFAYSHHARLDQTLLLVTTAPPRLTAWLAGSAHLHLSWHTNFTGYVLEGATGLPAATWTTVTNNVLVTGDSYWVAIDANAAPGFFRLRKP